MKVTAINTTGTKSTVTVSDAIFGGRVNDQLLGQALRVHIANSHQGTSRVKTRSEVARTKKKWFKQKGTGNARHAQRSAPLFVGGGVAHGPKGVRPANLTLSQKQKKEALKAALRLQTEKIIISDGVEKLGAKTAVASKTLQKIVAEPGMMLLVASTWVADLEQGVRNLPFVKLTTAEHVNVYDVCAADTIVMSPEALEALSSRLETKKTAVKTEAKAAPKKAPAKKVAPAKAEAKPAKKAPASKTTKKKVTAKK